MWCHQWCDGFAKVCAASSSILQALGKLKLSGWGFSKRSDEAAAAPAAAAAAGSRSSSTSSSQMHSSAEHQQQQHEQLAAAATEAAAAGSSSSSRSSPTPAASMDSLHAAAPLDAFLLSLDGLVQHAFILLRDQLKRRLTPLLADCVSPENNVMPVSDMALVTPAGTEGGNGSGGGAAGQQGAGASAGEPISPTMAGAAVGGSAAASHAHAEAALMTYRRWVRSSSV